MGNLLAFDCETSGLSTFHGARPFFLSCCSDKGDLYAWEWPVDPFTRIPKIPKADKHDILELFDGYDQLAAHNGKFDIRMLASVGIDLAPRWADVHDTLLMSHVLHSGENHGLKELAVKYLAILDDDEKALAKAVQHARTVAKRRGWKLGDDWQADYWLPKALDPDSTICRQYAVKDAERTALLASVFLPELKREGLLDQYERERQLQPIVYRMEGRGFPVNPRTVLSLQKEFRGKAARARFSISTSPAAKAIAKVAKDKTFNPGSTIQLRELLFDKLCFEPLKQMKTGPSTDADTLLDIWTRQLGNYADEEGNDREFDNSNTIKARVIDSLLALRSAGTSESYLAGYYSSRIQQGDDWLIYGSLNQTGTRGTRFSSSNPNLQNIDRLLRNCFVPRKETFWYDLDYQNLELRIYAVLSGETWLLKAFQDGTNVMKLLAKEIWGSDYSPSQYKRVKNGSYARLYGASPHKADVTYGKPGACAVFDELFNIHATTARIKKELHKHDGYVETLFGYRCYPHEMKEHGILNTKIQGTAGDILKHAMLNCERNVPDARLLMCVHDELIFELDNPIPLDTGTLQDLVANMIEPGTRVGIPLAVGADLVTKHWGDRKEIRL